MCLWHYDISYIPQTRISGGRGWNDWLANAGGERHRYGREDHDDFLADKRHGPYLMGAPQQALIAVGGAAAVGYLTPTSSNVVFELHGDAVPWIDVGYTGHGVMNIGCVVDASNKPSFCTGSIGPNGLTTTVVRAASGATNNDFKFGTGSWYAEAQVYGIAGTRIYDTRANPASNGWVLNVGSSRELTFTLDGVAYSSAASVITSSVWQHVVVSYDGTDLRLFVAGVSVLSTTVALNITTGQHLSILNTGDADGVAAGNGASTYRVAELRVVKGEAITSGFTAPTAVMTDAGAGRALQTNVTYSNVVLRSTYDANVNDVSNAARTMTAGGSAAVSALQSKFGGSSLLLGSGNYLSTPDAADLDLGTGDYQFQVWARRSGSATDKMILSCYVDASNGYSMSMTSGQIPYWNETGDGVDGTFLDALADTTWEHVAVGRKDAVLYTFVNGLLQRFVNSTATVNCTGTLFVSRLNNTYPGYEWPGNLDDLQLVKGECQLYRSFLVPTAALPVS